MTAQVHHDLGRPAGSAPAARVELAALLLVIAALAWPGAAAGASLNAEDLVGVSGLPVKPEVIAALSSSAQVRKSMTLDVVLRVDVALPPRERDAKDYARTLAKYRAKHAKKGTVPYRFCVSMHATRSGRKPELYADGKSTLLLIDQDKRLVLNKKVDNGKLCPT